MHHDELHPINALHAAGVAIYARWSAFWNLDLALADSLVAPRFALRYAQPGSERFDAVTQPHELAALIAASHEARPGMRFTPQGPAICQLHDDGGRLQGHVARPYRVDIPQPDGLPICVSGTDILRVAGARICEVWSVSGGLQGRLFDADGQAPLAPTQGHQVLYFS